MLNTRRWTLAAMFAALCFAIALPLYANSPEGNWKQIDDDDGVIVWKNEIPGQELPGFRGQVIIEASLEKIVSVLEDNKRHTDWMYRCAESTILKQLNSEEAIVYNRTTSPWPVWDRDVILNTKFTYNADKSLLTLDFKNVKSDLRAVPEKVVRMPRLSGFYKMWRLGPSKTKVLYQVEADVGGSIPRWLADRVSKDLPYITLSRLRDRVLGKI